MKTSDSAPLFAGIEAGGTKFNCVLAYSPQEVVARTRIPTTTPTETFSKVLDFYQEQETSYGAISAFGVACFGPLDLHAGSPSYGYITATPKPHWSNVNVVQALQAIRKVPIGFDTDVNGSALGELYYGAAKDLKNFVYVTIGTGIGAGVYANGQTVNGSLHPEVGHMLVPLDDALLQEDLNSSTSPQRISVCPFHSRCLTSLASGPALEARWGINAESLEKSHPAWDIQAKYLATMCMNLSMAYCPEKIILGGGVMHQAHLLPLIRQHYQTLMSGYMLPKTPLENFIVTPGTGDKSGELGAILLAQHSLQESLQESLKASL